MKTFPPDPLSSEEREFATMLARLTPHGVPSPEIDAQILSASHDAVAGPRTRRDRPRWPVALGLAASMVLAVGVAWQLRPTQPAAGDPGSGSREAWTAADAPAAAPAPVARTQAVPADEPPVAEERAAAADSADAPPAERVVPSGKAPAAPPPARTVPPEPRAPPQKNLVPPSPPPPVAPSVTAAPTLLPGGSVQQSKSLDTATAQRQEALRQVQAGSAMDAGSTAEATTGMRRELRVAPTSERVQDSASPSEGHASRTRRTDLQVPVAADAQLQIGDWLERVRTRYGLGDEEAARRSLLLFVQDHPTEPVPGDLEPLLDE